MRGRGLGRRVGHGGGEGGGGDVQGPCSVAEDEECRMGDLG